MDLDHSGRTRISGGPVSLFVEILTCHGTIPDPSRVTYHAQTCTCKTKHALIPTHSIARRAAVLEGTPLAQALCPGARFLGAYLCGRCRGYEDIPRMHGLSMQALEVCQIMTWHKSLCTDIARVAVIKKAGASLANRCESWNTHCISTIPYPSAVIQPSRALVEQMRDLLGTLFPTGTWARRALPWQIGPAIGVKGGPGTHCSSRALRASRPTGGADSPARPRRSVHQ